MTTADYLESLQNDLNNIKQHLSDGGMEISSSDNFSTLATKTDGIQIGGGGSSLTKAVSTSIATAGNVGQMDITFQVLGRPQRYLFYKDALGTKTFNLIDYRTLFEYYDGDGMAIRQGQNTSYSSSSRSKVLTSIEEVEPGIYNAGDGTFTISMINVPKPVDNLDQQYKLIYYY